MLESPGTSKRYNRRDVANKELAISHTSVRFRERGTPKVSGPGTSERAVTSRDDDSLQMLPDVSSLVAQPQIFNEGGHHSDLRKMNMYYYN